MFYDDIFKDITENSPFSETATAVLKDGSSLELKGFLCSGSYGEDDLSKGYTVEKTVNKQSFKISLSSLPESVSVSSLARAKLTCRGKTYTIQDVNGNESGILSLQLVRGNKNG